MHHSFSSSIEESARVVARERKYQLMMNTRFLILVLTSILALAVGAGTIYLGALAGALLLAVLTILAVPGLVFAALRFNKS